MTRLVVFAPKRRLDVAFPEHVPVVNVLPSVLRHAGEQLADAGLAHEGWVLRRADGSTVDPGGTFAAQQVRDGEALYLVPRRADWPEMSYDDVVDAIAGGARRRGRRWTGAATRVVGLATGAVAAAVGLVVLALSGQPWTAAATTALGVAAGLVLTGVVLSRALGDATAGAVVAAAGCAYAFLGGTLLLADEPLGLIGAPHLMAGCALLGVAGVAGYLGAAEHARIFVGATFAGVCGVAASVVAFTSVDGPGAAALVVGVVLLFSPILPAMAVRIGAIPLPELPRTPDDLVRDEPLPDRRSVQAATARADEALTGLLIGAALVTVVGAGALVVSGRPAAYALAGVVSVAHLLRARFFVGVRHRIPLLVAGVAGLAGLAAHAPILLLPVVLGGGAVCLAAGLAYSRRHPSPRLGRLADILDVVLTLAVVPLVCVALGLFGVVRGLGG